MSAIPPGFEQRADSAAERLKATMGLPSVKVDGDAAAQGPEPPATSYIAQQRAAQREEQAQRRAEDMQAQGGPAPLPDEHVGVEFHEQIAQQPPQPPVENGQPTDQTSPRAQERIRELAGQRRELERTNGELQATSAQQNRDIEELRTANHALAGQIQSIQEAQLESLEPEDRARVLSDMNARQQASTIREEVMGEVGPALREVREHSFTQAMVGLAGKYAGFDAEIHPSKIQTVMESNGLNPEQAFRVIATDEELSVTHRPRNPRVPTVIPPRGTGGTARFAPATTETQDERQQRGLVDERDEWAKKARSMDPADKRTADRMLHQHLMNRLR